MGFGRKAETDERPVEQEGPGTEERELLDSILGGGTDAQEGQEDGQDGQGDEDEQGDAASADEAEDPFAGLLEGAQQVGREESLAGVEKARAQALAQENGAKYARKVLELSSSGKPWVRFSVADRAKGNQLKRLILAGGQAIKRGMLVNVGKDKVTGGWVVDARPKQEGKGRPAANG